MLELAGKTIAVPETRELDLLARLFEKGGGETSLSSGGDPRRPGSGAGGGVAAAVHRGRVRRPDSFDWRRASTAAGLRRVRRDRGWVRRGAGPGTPDHPLAETGQGHHVQQRPQTDPQGLVHLEQGLVDGNQE